MLLKLSPLAEKRWQRFKSLKRGYYCFHIFLCLILLAGLLEVICSHRALVVRHEGVYYFPSYGAIIPGKTFGLDYDHEVHYRDLKREWKKNNSDNFVILPMIPWGPNEVDLGEGRYPPYPPSVRDKHFLGTDTTGRDILARLLYGFRIAIAFSLMILVATNVLGIVIGCMMGYFGGWFDLLVQRIIEIWVNIPFLYVVMIIASIVVPNFKVLVGIMIFFGWTSMTSYMRTSTYKEKSREYVMAAEASGASTFRVIFRHILPNILSVVITFVPFTVSGGIVSLTSLDFLGFGLPPPTPSWGELLSQGVANISEAPWIVNSVIVAMVIVLSVITFIGEAVREAFDPKMFTYYE